MAIAPKKQLELDEITLTFSLLDFHLITITTLIHLEFKN